MKKVNVLKAWKNEEYRQSLTAEQIAALPANPAGELSDIEQMNISGGNGNPITIGGRKARTECSDKPELCKLF